MLRKTQTPSGCLPLNPSPDTKRIIAVRALFRFSIRELLLVTTVVGLAIALFRSEYERSRPFQATDFLNRLDIKKTLQRIAASEGRSQSIIATGGQLNAREYGGT